MSGSSRRPGPPRAERGSAGPERRGRRSRAGGRGPPRPPGAVPGGTERPGAGKGNGKGKAGRGDRGSRSGPPTRCARRIPGRVAARSPPAPALTCRRKGAPPRTPAGASSASCSGCAAAPARPAASPCRPRRSPARPRGALPPRFTARCRTAGRAGPRGRARVSPATPGRLSRLPPLAEAAPGEGGAAGRVAGEAAGRRVAEEVGASGGGRLWLRASPGRSNDRQGLFVPDCSRKPQRPENARRDRELRAGRGALPPPPQRRGRRDGRGRQGWTPAARAAAPLPPAAGAEVALRGPRAAPGTVHAARGLPSIPASRRDAPSFILVKNAFLVLAA